MPNYKYHLGFGVFVVGVCCIAAFFLGFEKIVSSWWKILPVTLVYSLLPDVDTQASKIRLLLTLSGLLLLAFEIYFIKSFFFNNEWIEWFVIVMLLLLIWVLPLLSGFKHRQFFHNILGMTTLSLPLLLIDYITMLAGMIAYSSHILLDKITWGNKQ